MLRNNDDGDDDDDDDHDDDHDDPDDDNFDDNDANENELFKSSCVREREKGEKTQNKQKLKNSFFFVKSNKKT